MASASDRRRGAAVAGHTGDASAARALLADPDPAVRATALGALGRLGQAGPAELAAALADAVPAVRRRACAVAVGVAAVDLVPLLDDPDPGVVEMAAWALGERAAGAGGGAVARLAAVATGHDDPLCREAAVAALGAVGDDRGLPAILAATRDRPAVRRRAVIALAPFSGPEVDAALAAALQDRDWQVRQAGEDLLSAGSDSPLGAHEEDLE
jgi:HEAT repeat protein